MPLLLDFDVGEALLLSLRQFASHLGLFALEVSLDLANVFLALFFAAFGHVLLLQVAFFEGETGLALCFLVFFEGLLSFFYLLQKVLLTLHFLQLLLLLVLVTLGAHSLYETAELLTHVHFVLTSFLLVGLHSRLHVLKGAHGLLAVLALLTNESAVLDLYLLCARLEVLSGSELGLLLLASVQLLLQQALALRHSFSVLLPRLFLQLLFLTLHSFAPLEPLVLFLSKLLGPLLDLGALTFFVVFRFFLSLMHALLDQALAVGEVLARPLLRLQEPRDFHLLPLHVEHRDGPLILGDARSG